MPHTTYPTYAAVDLGSNSFRLEVARVEDGQVYPLDAFKETIRLAAGLTADKLMDEASQARALACLERFGERLRGMPPQSVRAVGTNTLRVAKNAGQFLRRAEAALGFPIEIIAGREEARLIYVGVSHGQPPSDTRKLVVDIGGGSTELIIGTRYKPLQLESCYMGCVSYSQRFFPDGKVTRARLEEAELAVRAQLRSLPVSFARPLWEEAIGSSGTAKALAEILVENGFCDSGICREGMERLREHLLKVKDTAKLDLVGLRPDRVPVLAGGFSIMAALFRELGIERMSFSESALREGLLYDLIGRVQHQDTRDATVRRFMQRYHVDRKQAMRVEELAHALLEQLAKSFPEMDEETAQQRLGWAAKLHECGLAIAHAGFHKHGAYIIANADMPGFSRHEQMRLALLVLAQRGSLTKIRDSVAAPWDWAIIIALRLATLLYRSRSDHPLPPLTLRPRGDGFGLRVDRVWLKHNQLTEALLQEESREWKEVGLDLTVSTRA
jgi:exopolyphosphatase/guanosine-5'-triphosphate,3'-diphosphate pyrophosphatase